MKATELRLGNYVQTNVVQQVTVENLDFLENARMDHSVKPIELTTDWLVKLGFEFSDASYGNNATWTKRGRVYQNSTDQSYGFELVIHDDFDLESAAEGRFSLNGFKGVTKNIEWVHQLQNLYFALSGEELMISFMSSEC